MQGASQDRKNEGEKNSQSIQISAKTVKEAVKQGLAQLNLTEDQVEVQVLKEGSRGILGFGAEDAVIIITSNTLDEAIVEPSIPPTAVEAVAETASVHTAEPETVATSNDQPASEANIDFGERARDILATLLEKMGVEATVDFRIGHDLIEPDEDPPLTLDITGADLGVLIGRRGETLQALQFVVRQILSKEAGRWLPLVIDVESYLVRRRKKLQDLATRMADRAAFSQRKMTLEPMSAQDRRIIHLQLRNHEAVYTQSSGEGEKRKVVILPK
jgi:spoIIIJ-associated protein